MDFNLEDFITNFLRTHPNPFTAKDLAKILSGVGVDVSVDEVTFFLNSDCRIFPLQKKMFITKAGAFENQIFSFLPSQREIDQGLFVPGDRCIPFVDSAMPSYSLKFEFLGKLLPTKLFETDCNFARDLFTLYGDEYASQYIATDPACKDINIADNNFELPPKLKLTGISIEPVFKKLGYRYGDRFLARVKDWNEGIVEIFPVLTHKLNPFQISGEDFERQKWNETLENALLESFERMGPCPSMEEQLANVFYENRARLCVPDCGSIAECLSVSKKISFELFGVETRLWRTGESIPAVGSWNENMFGAGCDGTLPFDFLPDYIIDSLLKDQMYEKRENLHEIIEKTRTWQENLSESEKDLITLQIMGRNAVLRKNYNWFADFANGSLRHQALELYSQVREFVNELDCRENEFKELPQQELVTLSQLFTHISRILEVLSGDDECEETETYTMQRSLEGMASNFEDIKPLLISAATNVRKNRFNVI